MDAYQTSAPVTLPSSGRLRVAGYLAFTSALITVPWLMYLFNAANLHDPYFRFARGSMQIGCQALLIYLLLTFQQLLHHRHAFHHADKTISLLIQAGIIQTVVSLVGLAVPELAPAVKMFGFVMMVILGILHMMFGIWLLQLQSSLGGMHRPYCYLNIITGIAFASILLLPLGMLLSTIADVMLGTIFLQAVTKLQ
jgi:hypothetical protein